MSKQNPGRKIANRIKQDSENGARKSAIEDLFYDFNRSRAQIYKINFIRGIFFGLGSLLGGTLVVAVLVWALSFFVVIPGIGDAAKDIQQTLEPNDK